MNIELVSNTVNPVIDPLNMNILSDIQDNSLIVRKDGEFISAAVRSMLSVSVDDPDAEVWEKTGLVNLFEESEDLIYIADTIYSVYISRLLSDTVTELKGVEKRSEYVLKLDDWEGDYSRIGTQSVTNTRIKLDGKGYRISLSLGLREFTGYRLLQEMGSWETKIREDHQKRTGEYLDYYGISKIRDELTRKCEAVLLKFFGKDILDMSKSVDVSVSIAKPFDYISTKDYLDAEMVDPDNLKAFVKCFKGFRFIAAEVPGGRYAEQNLYKSKDNKTHYNANTLSKDKDERWDYLKHIFNIRNITVYADFYIPMEIAEFLTQMSRDKIKIGHMGMWTTQWLATMVHPQGSGIINYSINPLSNIADVNKAHEKDVVPPTNSDNLSIDIDGRILYIPRINKAHEYDNLFDTIGKSKDGDFCISDSKYLSPNMGSITGETRKREDIVSRKFPENMLIYADWINNKVSYTNSYGMLQVLDVEGYSPANISAIRNLLDINILDDTPLVNAIMGCFSTLIRHNSEAWTVIVENSIENDWPNFFGYDKDNMPWMYSYIKSDLLDGNIKAFCSGLHNKISVLYNSIKASDSPDTKIDQQHLDLLEAYSYRETWLFNTLAENSQLPILSVIGKGIKSIWSSIEREDTGIIEYMSKKSILSSMFDVGTILTLLRYGSKYSSVVEGDHNRRKIYLESKRDSKYKPTPVPFVENRFFLPHQAKNDSILVKNPEKSILAVDAGGGKTIQILTTILRNLKDGSSKKPLILCPGHLVRNYVEEIAYLTGGKLNVIVLNTSTNNLYGIDNLREIIKTAPRNTVVVADYDYIKGKSVSIPYGTTTIDLSMNSEFLREFDFDSVYMDESHYVKNPGSQRSRAAQRVINPITKRLLATGTFTPNQITDVIGQMNMLDPSVFGDINDFVDKYSAGRVGNSIIWKPGAEREVAKKISEQVALIGTKRKEWQYLLPRKVERFHFVELTEAQKDVYSAILEETIEKIKANEKLRKKLEEGNEEDAESIEALLQPYLQRLERFLAAPAEDDAGKRVLHGVDAISPKGKKVVELLREHINSDSRGKVLVFTSYILSAETIYKQLPPDLRRMAINYKAANKAGDLARFNNDDNIKFLIGVEHSLNTGLNLQKASRLIRIESVFNPGTLEQAESRINRPDPKNKNQRSEINLDWLLVDGTIDITKTARLISKMIKVTKFEEQNNPIYDSVPDDINLISLTLSNISELNNWSVLEEYLEGYQSLKIAQKKDYEEYRKRPDFTDEPLTIPKDSDIPNSSVLTRQPYIEGMTLPFMEELGIVRFSDYADEHNTKQEIDVTNSDEEYQMESTSFRTFDATGLRVHTEFGDGIVKTSGKDTVRVLLDSSSKPVTIHKLKTFIIVKPEKTPVKKRLSQLIGLSPSTAPKMVKPKVGDKIEKKGTKDVNKPINKPIPNTDTEESSAFNLYFSIINNSIGIGIDDDDPDVPEEELKRIGFKFSGPYMYFEIPTYRAMRNFIDRLKEGYTVPSGNLQVLEDIALAFTQGKRRLLNVKQANSIDVKNFWRIVKKPVPKGTVKPYPIIQDDTLYICFWISGQPSVSTLRRTMTGIPGITSDKSDGEYMLFADGKNEAKSIVEGLIAKGYKISNLKQIKEEWKEIKLVGRRKPT